MINHKNGPYFSFHNSLSHTYTPFVYDEVWETVIFYAENIIFMQKSDEILKFSFPPSDVCVTAKLQIHFHFNRLLNCFR